MILEAAILNVKEGQTGQFEDSFRKASAIITSMKGYLSHELHLCMEKDHQYLLLVRWETLEDHTIGFRGSAEYQQWRMLLHHCRVEGGRLAPSSVRSIKRIVQFSRNPLSFMSPFGCSS